MKKILLTGGNGFFVQDLQRDMRALMKFSQQMYQCLILLMKKR